MHWRSFIFPALLLASAHSLQADQHISRAETLVVTGTRTERALKDVPVRTEIITATDVQRLHARDLNEALQYVPGLQLRPIHGKTGYGVWLQGIDANRVLILVDGNPVSASTGSAVDTTQIAVSDIERIEIIKGAVSALYGTSAMGGVINIITRQSRQPFAASASVSGGSWGDQNTEDFPIAQRHARGQVGINRNQWSLNLNADLRNQDGWQADPDSNSTQGYEGSKTNLAGQLQYRFTPDLRLTLSPRFYHENLLNGMPDEFVPGIGSFQVNKKEITTTHHLGARMDQKLPNGVSWSLGAMTETFSGETQQVKVATPYIDQQRNTEMSHQQASVQVNLPIQQHTLTLGGQFSTETMEVIQHKRSDNSHERLIEVDNETATSLEFYMQDSWFIGEHLELLPGFRVHEDERFGTHFSPMLNSLLFTTLADGTQLNLRLGVGNGYRVPNLKERHYVFDHSHLGYKVMGNPDLEPESSISYQASIEWLHRTGTRLELSFFRNEISNLIESDEDKAESDAQGLLIYRYQNFEKALTQGMELVWFSPISKNLQLDLGYTLMQATDQITGKDLPNRPTHQLKFGFNWQTPVNDLELTVKARHESRQYNDAANTSQTPAFTVLDVKSNYAITPAWTLFAGINNLTDIQKDFERTDNRPEEGRFIYAGIRWDFIP